MLAAITAAGLSVVECREPTWTRSVAAAAFPGMSDDLYGDAIAGLPLAIVWKLSRGG